MIEQLNCTHTCTKINITIYIHIFFHLYFYCRLLYSNSGFLRHYQALQPLLYTNSYKFKFKNRIIWKVLGSMMKLTKSWHEHETIAFTIILIKPAMRGHFLFPFLRGINGSTLIVSFSSPKGTLSREVHKTFSSVLTTFTGAMTNWCRKIRQKRDPEGT
jgi:hypothetical protein